MADTLDDLVLNYMEGAFVKGEQSVMMAKKTIKNGGLKRIRPFIMTDMRLVERYQEQHQLPTWPLPELKASQKAASQILEA
jgi:tRNA(Ile)-lysidine synthase TilS/MesJ